MLRRRRDYYIGGRPRRPAGRIALAGVAVLALGATAAYGGYVPVMSLAPGQSAGPVAIETASPAGTAPSPGVPTRRPQPPAPTAPSATTSPTMPVPPPCAAPDWVEPAVVRSHGPIDKKVVALTFDDGIDPENTRRILRILEREKVNATFFPTGIAMKRFSDVWRAVAKANFPIANHTYGHVRLAGMCYEEQRAELARAATVFSKLGIPQLPVMRPPYAQWDDTTPAAAAAEGLRAVVLWNVDTRDWAGVTAAAIRRSALSGGRGSIVLMHTFPEATAAALPAIIKGYRDRGFQFVTIGQLLGIEGPVPFPDPR